MQRTIENETLRAVEKLVGRFGRYFGMRVADRDEVVQEVMLTICESSFHEPDEQLLKTLVRRRLVSFARRKTTYRRMLERRLDQTLDNLPTSCKIEGVTEPIWVDDTPRTMDVAAIIATLAPRNQDICRLLADGESVRSIAAKLGCDWHCVKRRIGYIRAEFERAGLRGWLETAPEGADA